MRCAALLLLCTLSFDAHSVTDWERWLEKPTSSNAARVGVIEYTGKASEDVLGPRITRDLQVLAKRVHAGDPSSLRLAMRLTETTDPGANLEDLHQMIGAAVASHTEQFLQAVKANPQLRSCPGVGFLGTAFVDQTEKRDQELAARARALKSIAAPSLAAARKKCLAALQE